MKRSNGEGTIYFTKAKKLWVAEILLPDGKKKRKRSKRQSVVKEWLEKEKLSVRGGVWVSSDKAKYGDFLDRYLEEVAAHTLRPQTLVSYSHEIKKYIKPALGEMRITSIRPDHIQRFYSDLVRSGLSKTTVRYIHCIVRKSLSIALAWGLVGRNVAEAVTSPTPEQFEIKPLTLEEAKRFLKVLEGDRLYAYYVLLLTTGIRRGEGLGLLKQYVNLEEGTIIIKHSLSFLPHRGLVLGDTKSEKSVREIALPEFTVNVLKDHLSKYSQNSRFVFATGNGTPFSPRNILRHFKLKLAEAGLPKETRIHDLRHSYASWMLKTTSVKDLQAILGHAQASTTLDIYAHLLPGYNREAAKRVDGLFGDGKVTERQ